MSGADRPVGRPAIRALIVAVLVAGSACGPGLDRESRHVIDLEVDRRVADLRRGLDIRAARARDRLEAVRADAEKALARSARDRGIDPVAAQDQARLALEEGAAVLNAAARDGSEAAAGWARVIQDRMMRLQQSIRSPGDADGLSQDS